jgi:hypothetical protein
MVSPVVARVLHRHSVERVCTYVSSTVRAGGTYCAGSSQSMGAEAIIAAAAAAGRKLGGKLGRSRLPAGHHLE